MPAPVQVAVVAPVQPGHEEALRRAIAAWPDPSPFASLPGTHFGRVVVLDRPGPDHRLVFSVVTDIEPAECLRMALAAVGDLWAHCHDWPGGDDERLAYLHRHTVPPSLPFATWTAPVARIVKGLDVQRRLRAFVLRSRGSDPASLQRDFAREFGA